MGEAADDTSQEAISLETATLATLADIAGALRKPGPEHRPHPRPDGHFLKGKQDEN